MFREGKNRGTYWKSWTIAGVLILGLMGVSGCGSANSAAAAAPSTQQSSASAQNSQGQHQNLNNPALQAVMEIRRLQGDQQAALTSEQKDKLKPILQELINTTNPSDDFLKEKADSINAVFTAQQKSYLTSHTQRNNRNGNTQRGQGAGQNGSKENGSSYGSKNSQNRAASNGQGRQPMQAQDIYKQVLNSLS